MSNIEPAKRPKTPLKTVFGGIAILAGIMLMLFGLLDFSDHGLKYEKLAELKSGELGFPEIKGQYPVEKLTRYRIGKEAASVEVNVAHYQQSPALPASAIVFPLADSAQPKGETGLRHDLWQAAAEAIQGHTDKNAVFLSWWDDGQRVQFLTGRKPWLNQPVARAFPDKDQKTFWQQAGGGFDQDETKLRQLARWLSMDADAALAEMAQAIPKDQPVYWLLCLDDLARLSEIEALSGVKLPFEARIFPQADNIHGQIAEVKRWADEKGVGSYLVQQLPSGGARVWRITTEEGVKTLLARLLPFTTSLAKPLEPLSLVYQSGWGGYLSVYEWRR